MNFRLLFLTALRSLNKHKMRSLLTTLGIIIGVVSIIAVMSIGEGAKYRVKQEISKLGTNFIIILGASPKNVSQRSSGNLTLFPKDLTAIKDDCKDIYLISPGAMAPTKAVYEGENWQTTMGGVDSSYAQIRDWPLTSGEFFSSQDVRSGNKVVVLGQRVAQELFDNEDPIGKIIRIKKLPFKVIGVLGEKGKTPDGRDQDDIMLAPITTVQRKILGKFNYGAILLSAKNKESMDRIASQITSLLRQQHHLQESDENDFTLFTQNDIAQASDAASSVLNLLLFVIASISLIVGGIGIMNIMLVTVTERTKEIGIRMALGATTNKILTQFIIEAVAICFIGGLVGVILGVIVAQIVGMALGWPIFISTASVVVSFGASVLIGMFFGYYPALQASQLNPVEALLDH